MKKAFASARRALLYLIVWVGISAISFPAHADVFFTGLDGDWQGRGFVKTDPRAPEESIRCRLNLGLSRLKDRLYVRGTCSIASFMLPVNGSIVANGNRYSADLFRNLVQVSTSDFSGQRRGSNLTLQYTGVDLATKQTIRAAMNIRKRRNGFDISLSRTQPKTNRLFDIGTISFKAR